MIEEKDTLYQKHFAFGIIWLKLTIPETIFSLKIQLFYFYVPSVKIVTASKQVMTEKWRTIMKMCEFLLLGVVYKNIME